MAEAKGWWAWLVEETRRLIPPFLFFLVAFNLLALTAHLSGAPGGLMTYATAAVSALICGKAVLISDSLPIFRRAPDRPLIWNVIGKTLLYSAVSTAIRLLEQGIDAFRHQPHLGAGVKEEVAAFTWAHFTMTQLWLAALFLVFTAFHELAGVVGRDRVYAIFFGPPEGSR